MATISCDVIKDLLPLYVDGVLSADSRKLMEEHLAACPQCRACREELRQKNVRRLGVAAEREGEVIKKLRRRIKARRLRAVCLTAVLAAVLAGMLWYAIAWEERYLPYDSSAFGVREGDLCLTRPYCRGTFCLAPDGETEFLYLTSTLYNNWQRQRYDEGHQRQDAGAEQAQADAAPLAAESQVLVIRHPVHKSVYYVPEAYAKRLRQGSYWLEPEAGETAADYAAKNQELLDELKAASVLIAAAGEAEDGGPDER